MGPLEALPERFPFTSASPLRYYTEPAGFLLFPYIAGLTIMDDRIAEAVDHHSGFREHPWSRLFGTVDAAIQLVFGNEQEFRNKAEQLQRFHQSVSDDGGERAKNGEGAPLAYEANNSGLQAWVLAAVFKGVEEAHRRWLTPLDESARRDVYDDIRRFGIAFGVSPDCLPTTLTSSTITGSIGSAALTSSCKRLPAVRWHRRYFASPALLFRNRWPA